MGSDGSGDCSEFHVPAPEITWRRHIRTATAWQTSWSVFSTRGS